MLECSYADMLAYWNADILDYWNSGILTYLVSCLYGQWLAVLPDDS